MTGDPKAPLHDHRYAHDHAQDQSKHSDARGAYEDHLHHQQERERDDESGRHSFGQQEEDEHMSEMIRKHRAELQDFVDHSIPHMGTSSGVAGGTDDELDHHHRGMHIYTPDLDNLQNIPPSTAGTATNTGSAAANSHGGDLYGSDTTYHTPQATRSPAAERLLQLSRTERTDRMRLAELSGERNERIGRKAIMTWNPDAKVASNRNRSQDRDRHRATDQDHDRAVRRETRTFVGDFGRRNGAPKPMRARSNTTPKRAASTTLADYSKDFVQQALDFTGAGLGGEMDDDEDDEDDDEEGEIDDDETEDGDGLPPTSPSSMEEMLERKPRGKRSTKAVRKYVKHMESTIAHLVQQKDELLRNQAEFDKYASGMFPTLETLNDQLSQIVQDRMQQSQANLKDDLSSEFQQLRIRLNEMDAEAKQRRHDADLQEQKRDLDYVQIKGEIASLGTTGTLQSQKMELLTSQVKQLQRDIQQSVRVMQALTQQYQIIDKQVASLQGVVGKHPSTMLKKTRSSRYALISALVLVTAIIITLLSYETCGGIFDQCRPLT